VFSNRKQAWLWSLGDTYRIKDRPRYMSGFAGMSALEPNHSNQYRDTNTEVRLFDYVFESFLK